MEIIESLGRSGKNGGAIRRLDPLKKCAPERLVRGYDRTILNKGIRQKRKDFIALIPLDDRFSCSIFRPKTTH
jgi:hypothetical protein